MKERPEREEIKSELEMIAQKTGTLNPHDVVKFASNPKTALHSCFTWDDTEAARQYRLYQARNLIRTIVNVITDDEIEYRAFVSLRGDRQHGVGYRPMVSIMDDEELRGMMLQDALEEMQTFKEKYKALKELVEVFEAMDKVEKKIQPKRPARLGKSRHGEAMLSRQVT